LPLGTALLTVAVACAQPATAALVRAWFPSSVQRASTLYINGQLLGGLLGIAVTPLFVPALGWRGALLVWTAIALWGALVWFWTAPPVPAHADEPRRLRSLVGDLELWIAAGILTAQNLVYFTAATFLPFLLHDRAPNYVALVFFLMNGAAVLPTVLGALRWSFASSVGFYVASGFLAAGGALTLLLGLEDVAWLGGLGIGLGTSMAYLGILSLVPRISREEDVAGYSAIVLTAGYLLTFVGPLAGGALVDLSHSIKWSFAPSVISGALMAGLGLAASRFRLLGEPVAPLAAVGKA
jgi:CP family cyanate transporter-like MFS transporter